VRKIVAPIVYIIFGITMNYFQSEYVGQILLSETISYVTLYRINKAIFIGIPVLLFVFEIYPQSRKIVKNEEKLIYLLSTGILLTISAWVFILIHQWK
jgi:EamA domain-containing membrane protein RarD